MRLFSPMVLLAPQPHSHFTKWYSIVKVPTTPPFGVSFSIFQPSKCWTASSILVFGFVRPVSSAPASLPCGSQQMPDQDAHGNAQGRALLRKEQGHQWKHTHHGPYWNKGQHFFWVGFCRAMQLILISAKVEEVVMLSQLSMLEWGKKL